jgi:hypothetical protein
MRTWIYAVLAMLLCAPLAHSQSSPFSQNIFAPQVFVATGVTGTPIQLNGLISSTSTVGSSYTVGSITVAGTSLATATFGVLGSSDNGATYYPLPIYTVGSPATTPATTITVTTNGLYQINLVGLTHVKFVTSGTFTATNLTLTLTASPNGSLSRNNGSSGGMIYPGEGIPCSTGSAWCESYTEDNLIPANLVSVLNQSTTGVAATASALAATPDQCGTDQFSTGIKADGTANCATPSGGVTRFAVGSWPSWLMPTVTNPTTTPSLAVAAGPIPNGALANSTTTVNGQTCALGGACAIPTNICGGIASPCDLQQINLTAGPASTITTAALTTTRSSIPIASGTGFTFAPHVIVGLSDGSNLEWDDCTAFTSPNLTGCTAVFGTSTKAFASGAVVIQMTEGTSLSATSFPLTYVLANAARGVGVVNNITANTTKVNIFSFFLAGLETNSAVGGGDTTFEANSGNVLFTNQAQVFNSLTTGVSCDTAMFGYILPTTSFSWTSGGTNLNCTIASNLIPPNAYCWVSGSAAGVAPVAGDTPSACLTQPGVLNVASGFQINNAAPTGHCLVGNGAAYVDGSCSGGGGGTIPPAGIPLSTGASYNTPSFGGVNAPSVPGASSVALQGIYSCTTATTLSSAVATTDTTISLTSAACLPQTGFAVIPQNGSSGSFPGFFAINIISWNGIVGSTLQNVVQGLFGTTAYAATSGQTFDGITSIIATNSSTLPTFVSFQDGATLNNPTDGLGGFTFAAVFPKVSGFGPGYQDGYWEGVGGGLAGQPVIYIGIPQLTDAPVWNLSLEPTMMSTVVSSNGIVGDVEGNYSNGPLAEYSHVVYNDSAVDGGQTSWLGYGTHSSGFTPGGNEEPANFGQPLESFLMSVGGALYIGSEASDTGVDPIIHFVYNFKPIDDMTIDSTGVRILDAAPASGGPDCVTVSTTGLVGNTGAPCYALTSANAGMATLAAGTATVSTAAACTPGTACVYKLTNCGLNSSIAVGVPSIGTVTAGTSFVINSYTAAAALAVDSSKVCWQIN